MATFSAVAGTVFKYTVTATLTVIPGVGSMSFSGGDKNDINVTAIDDETEVFIPGRRTAKELNFPMFYDPADAGQVAMLAAYDASAQTPVAMSIVDDDAGDCTLTFSGYVKNMTKKYDLDGAVMFDVVIKLTTAITTTA
jgi:hypothetical protein